MYQCVATATGPTILTGNNKEKALDDARVLINNVEVNRGDFAHAEALIELGGKNKDRIINELDFPEQLLMERDGSRDTYLLTTVLLIQ